VFSVSSYIPAFLKRDPVIEPIPNLVVPEPNEKRQVGVEFGGDTKRGVLVEDGGSIVIKV
jgi:hypothetical protein